LDIFLKKLINTPFFCRSPELQVFVRPNKPKVDESLNSLPKQRTDYVLKMY